VIEPFGSLEVCYIFNESSTLADDDDDDNNNNNNVNTLS
jgi:hypothetical protein